MSNDRLSAYHHTREAVLFPPQKWMEGKTDVSIIDNLLRSNQELEQFAVSTSHDLQEPLKVISLYLQLFNKKYKGKFGIKEDELISSVLAKTKRMQELIVSMLDQARAGKANVKFSQIDSSIALKRAIENLRVTSKANSAHITYDICPTILGNEIQLTQVFQNLINNAIKFCKPSECPYIHISATPKDHQWLSSIQDNGIGIDAEHIPNIFDMFKQEHIHQEYAGNGIGLALCKRIVEMHGGHIWAESQKGYGTTVYFTLPQVQSDSNQSSHLVRSYR